MIFRARSFSKYSYFGRLIKSYDVYIQAEREGETRVQN